MTVVVAVAVGLLGAAGIYLVLARSLFRVILGFSLLSHAANLIVLAAGGWGTKAPILEASGGEAVGAVADPLPQALVLTAIVISMAVTVFLLAAAVAVGEQAGSTEVAPALTGDDGRPRAEVSRELASAAPREARS